MKNIQHIILKTIEELPTDSEGFVSEAKIKSSTGMDLVEIQGALKILHERGYISSTRNTNYKITEKGIYYTWVFEAIDDRLIHHLAQTSSLLYSLLALAFGLLCLVAFVLLKVW